ncbi:filamentous haemagglutinin family protein [Pseudomonas sp. FEN]|uniref:filamentous haemagglutinin family protein n=1 Tax=Pseudomonas sp. FEN TaxID=2767468 RepID=UPI00174A964F|nr:filamentous haemagglutinin family protein [Pseudomonas sp. FEN]CAD5201817.1 Filamentous haemagglutinin family outer membrane protein associated with VreARI signalling system [Pseudomonas sp. FEN]
MLRCKPPARLNAQARHGEPSIWALKPVAQAIALLMVAGSAQAQTAFSSGWFADKGAAQAASAGQPAVQLPGMPPPLAQQQQANQQLQRSLANFNNSVAAIAAQQAAQAAGRQAALARLPTVPDGLGEGGLKVDTGLTQGWLNAKAPVQTQTDGKTTVSITQTADKAILNWETFNVGRNTTVDFAQQSNWAVLNRINDPQARPSQIQGQIQGNGTVMLVNRNGVIFSGTSQVNVRNLVAAAATISDSQFNKGLYVDSSGTQPTFTDAVGQIQVQRGAQIQTLNPASSTDSGGYALLLGSEVLNDGSLVTPNGQVTLAAGDNFYIRQGQSTAGNPRSTTRGNEVVSTLNSGSSSGTLINSGLITASTGDITLTGHQVQQNGVIASSTSTNTRGTVHLLNSASDSTGSIVLGSGSTTAILLDASSTGLDSQRAAALAALNGNPGNLITGKFNNLSTVVDRIEQSRVEIVSGGIVDFQKGSLTLATGGQVAVSAGQRSLVRDGSIIDVSGAVGVKVAMEANSIKVNVQGNELRDASGNRDAGKLSSSDVWVDVRDLVYVPAGTDGYPTARWYTAGGLLEVSGYLGTQGHGVGEWMAQGGSVTFTGKDVVTQQDAQINLSGGTLDVQSGYIKQTWLTGSDGRLYELSSAPGDLLYTGVYKGYADASQRWGQTDYYYNPLIAPRQRYELGYTVGRDAGNLVISTNSAVLEGQVIGDVYHGPQQNQAANPTLDGYQQSQTAVARRAQLIAGTYTPIYDPIAGVVNFNLGASLNQVTFAANPTTVAAGVDLSSVVPASRQGKLVLDTNQLNGFQLGAIKVAAKQQIEVDNNLSVTNGGTITLYGPQVTVNADLTARGGTLQLGNVLNQIDPNQSFKLQDTLIAAPGSSVASTTVAAGVTLNTAGLWTNQLLDSTDNLGLPYVNGGLVSLRSSGNLSLQAGSLIDVSSGAALQANGKLLGGKGGSLILAANAGGFGVGGVLSLGGDIRAVGVNGGGTLTLQSSQVVIGTPTTPVSGAVELDGDFFKQGFSAYDITGNEGLTVADGTQVDVTQPVYRLGDNATTLVSGSDPAQALQVWTPDLYQQDPLKGVLTQRRGASLSLQAGTLNPTDARRATTVLTVGSGAVISVDPGQAISLGSIGQLTLNGTLNAWGGKVSLNEIGAVNPSQDVNGAGNSRSILLGDEALIDVAARAATAVDMRGQVYGQVSGGGSIVIGGGAINAAAGTATAADLFIVVSKGARLDASGTQANLDIAGQGLTRVASNGGSISLGSNNGLYLQGSFVARAGGQGAAGGALSVVLQTPMYSRLVSPATDRVMQVRELVLGQTTDSDPLPDINALAYGHGQLAADQVLAGGFGNLAVYSNGFLSFNGNLNLSLSQSLQLYAGAFTLAQNVPDTFHVNLSAPSLLLGGIRPPNLSSTYEVSPVSTGSSFSSQLPSQAEFFAEGAVIDVRNNVVFGSRGSFNDASGNQVQVQRRGFDQVNLTSQGDLRFLAGIPNGAGTINPTTQLITAGDLHLNAAQLYPETGSIAAVTAGAENTLGTRLLTIGRTTQTVSQLPYSAFGSLTLLAPTIEQGGVVRAPLGLIKLGNGSTRRVELLPGSLTSVSGEGLIMPYGGTSDGQTYLYNGQNVTLYGQTGLSGGSGIGVVMGGQSVVVSAGATLDLSGGGDLLGAGFVSGRGGSTDARYNPLVQVNPNGTFSLPGLATNPVYAIVPGVQQVYAPSAGKSGAQDPVLGQQITIGAGVPGLAPGTYTLLPSTYALLPGAFRVELNGLAGVGTGAGALAMRNGSWSTAGQLSIANTGIRNSAASQVILTSANVLRTYSQYNETSYDQFAIADAARLGVPRPMIEADAKSLQLNLVQGASGSAFSFNGIGLFGAAEGGHAGTVGVISSGGAIEVVSAGTLAPASFVGVMVDDRSLNALGAASLTIGGMPAISYGQGGNSIGLGSQLSGSVVLRSGVKLAAPEVLLVSSGGAITVEQGASISTLGMGPTAYDANQGYIYDLTTSSNGTARYNFLGISNGLLQVLTPSLPGAAGIHVGMCNSAPCTGQTELYSSGSIVVGTGNDFVLADNVRYGTRHLTLALSAINLGSDQALADAASRNLLPAGLSLSQSVLTRLLKGDTQYGAPALETLELAAHDALNIYGSATLDTYDPLTGKSLLNNLVLSTPAIYGAGSAADVATIHTADLIWNGAANPAGSVVSGGAGTGSGRLNLQTETLEFGYGPYSQPNSVASLDRLLLGFSEVDISASQRVTANHKGSLSVYQSQGVYQAGSGFAYSGGNLNISTPLLTGEAGSVNTITVGGALNVTALSGTQTRTGGQGAKLSLNANSLALDTAVVLSSGQLNLTATQDLTLGDGAQIDMAGRAIKFNDVTQYSWGGDVTLKSTTGNIYQAAGSHIDLSAQNNRAGQFTAQAVDPTEGLVDLRGSILGSSSGFYDAGGTYLPYLGGFANIQAQRLGASGAEDASFAALNQRLNAGQVYGARTFQIKQGNLTIGNDLKANAIVVSLDNGSLLVNGKVDASGVQVGSINLSARQGLTLAGGAVLDAHGSGLQVDSQGKIIDSPNRAMVELNSGQGLLTLASGTIIDLRAGTGVALGSGPGQNDGRARGTLELDAPRLGGVSAGDIAIDASGNLAIRGARSIAVNGTWQYNDAPLGTDPAASGRPYQVINQAYLDGIDQQSSAFVDAALLNNNLLQNKLAGLYNATYADVLHLRPAVEIVSATPNGDLVVQGDIDLSGYRYASLNPHSQKTSVYGSGEVGKLALRAGGDLNIYGSVTDGFAPPPKTQDDNGWLLLSGIDFSGGNIVVPAAGVTLANGTTFPAGSVLNYALPIQATTLVAGTRLPVSVTLDQTLVLPAGTVLSAAIRDSGGNLLFAAGTLLTQAQSLPAGTQLDAGTLLNVDTALRAFSWPKGVALPSIAGGYMASNNLLTLNGDLALGSGALIPSGTNVQLPGGGASVQLRPEVAGRQGALWGIAPMLAEGSQSWSLRMVAGADTTAADNRVVQINPIHGDLHLADSHYGLYGKPSANPAMIWTTQGSLDWYGDLSHAGLPVDPVDAQGPPTLCADYPKDCVPDPNSSFDLAAGGTRFSVIRTGAADLTLSAGGSLSMDSLFGVYTAGTSSSPTYTNDPYNLPKPRNPQGTVLSNPLGGYESLVNGGADSVYRAWYPDAGGNLTIKVGGDLTGNILTPVVFGVRPWGDAGYDSASVADWLWRQGSGTVNTGTSTQATAWWINFGSYTASSDPNHTADQMIGFTGFGTLGGGNLDVQVGGNAGLLNTMAGNALDGNVNPRNQGLVLAVASTGRVMADGSLQLTGGGNLSLRVAGALNPAGIVTQDDQNGVVTNLRGQAQLLSDSSGTLALVYGSNGRTQAPGETRGYTSFNSTRSVAAGGLTLVPGDATFDLSTLGDQVVQTVVDPGRVTSVSATPYTLGDGTQGNGLSWFSLWTDRTAIHLFSAGGNLTPYVQGGLSDNAAVYPSILSAVADNGSLYFADAANVSNNLTIANALTLAPSANSQLQLLAADSIYGGNLTISQSSAAPSVLATPVRPAFIATQGSVPVAGASNLSPDGNTVFNNNYPLFAFGPNSASGQWNADAQPARFYALSGDLVGVRSGRTVTFTEPSDSRFGQTWYEGGGAVWMQAGRDIVSSGTLPAGENNGTGYQAVGNLFVQNNPTDISQVSAGRDILYSNFNVAGPGTLVVSAGRNILMADKTSITSLGAVVPGDSRPGASIVMQAGVGPNGPDYQAFIAPYLDPSNQAQAGTPLASQPGKVVKTYDTELVAWLGERYGFTGSVDEARAYYAALPPQQQDIFARSVYFAELKAAGREYNLVGGVRQGSYLRGREAIAALFPEKDVAGNPILYQGAITLYGPSGVHTNFGGDIQMLAPGGGLVFGIEGAAPPSTAGIITQGQGNIQLFAQDSILLGQSRVMTTFGGSITAWSAAGDINAGRGSKTTVVYTPPKRVYDSWGNVTLSPVVPSTGAGIATLNPIPEVLPGDIDLIAPLGTIDAGEAGIRVSGNVNIAALQVVNAANIQVQGKSSGVPVVASVNTGAITSASAAATSAAQAADNVARQQQASARQNLPSVFSVQVLSFGQERLEPSRDGASRTPTYNPDSPVQVLGAGPLSEQARARLTEEERGNLTL